MASILAFLKRLNPIGLALTEIRDNLKIVMCYQWLKFIKIVFLALHIRTLFR